MLYGSFELEYEGQSPGETVKTRDIELTQGDQGHVLIQDNRGTNLTQIFICFQILLTVI